MTAMGIKEFLSPDVKHDWIGDSFVGVLAFYLLESEREGLL